MDIYLKRFLIFAACLPCIANAKLEYDFNQLMMKNSEQVGKLIADKIRMAQKHLSRSPEDEGGVHVQPEAKDALKDAVRIALSRPDQDGARAGLYARARRDLGDIGELDNVLHELALEAMRAIKAAKITPRQQATYIYLLENLMAEVKPELEDSAETRKLIEAIRDADLQLNSDVKKQLLLKSMARIRSPSETAKLILAGKRE